MGIYVYLIAFFIGCLGKASACDVLIDAGHGGADLGTRHIDILEKNIALNAALELKAIFEDSFQKQVQLIRKSDEGISLNQRQELISKMKCRVFLSLHINSHIDTRVSGVEIYYSSPPTPITKQSLTTTDYEKIIDELLYQHSINQSQKLANNIKKGLEAKNPHLNIRSLSQKLRILEKQKEPSLLIELGYLSNLKEREFLTHPQKRKTHLFVIAKETSTYLDSHNEKKF